MPLTQSTVASRGELASARARHEAEGYTTKEHEPGRLLLAKGDTWMEITVRGQPFNSRQVTFVQARTNGFAVTSLVFGIISWFMCPLFGGIVAVVTGHVAHGQIRSSGEGGDGLATAGLVLGYIHLTAAAAVILFWLLVLGGLAALLGAAGSTQ